MHKGGCCCRHSNTASDYSYQKQVTGSTLDSLEEAMPEVYTQLKSVVETLERHYREMQDIEFTIDDGRLYYASNAYRETHRLCSCSYGSGMLREGLLMK